jgi:predicted dehydrogenase
MTVHMALVGAGNRGTRLIREFDSLPDCRVAQVCDMNFSRLLSVREWFPHIPITAVYDDVLQDAAIEAVVLATPAASHYPLALAALQAGKHVLVEIPLASEVAQADELVSLAARNGCILAVGHTQLYHPAIAEMQTMMALDEVGQWCYMESSRMHMAVPANNSDVFWSLAIHDLATALFLARERPVMVTAAGRDFVRPDVIDAAFVTVKYESGRFSQHHVSWLSPHRVRRFFVAGHEGALVFSDNRPVKKVRLFRNEERPADPSEADYGFDQPETVSLALTPDIMGLPEAEWRNVAVRRQCADFIGCIAAGREPVADGRKARDVVDVLTAATRSLSQGWAPVRL